MPAGETQLESRPQPSRMYRWLVLIFVSLAMFGNYYIYDSINPLERIFLEQLGFSASMFGWLNASYSVAAVLTLLIGGILIDRFGLKKSLTVLFSAVPGGRRVDCVSRQFHDDGCGTHLGGLGGRVADCCRHRGSGSLVQGQGTELRFRHQPDDRSDGLHCCRQLAHVGQVGLLPQWRKLAAKLAPAAATGSRRGLHRRHRRRRCIGRWRVTRRGATRWASQVSPTS